MTTYSAGTTILTPPNLDVRKPKKQRRKELNCAILENNANNKPPLMQVKLNSLGELLWVLLTFRWSGGIVSNISIPWIKQIDWFTKLRKGEIASSLADLRGADLSGVDLVAMDLQGANLRDADLRGSNLTAASLILADLGGTLLTDTILKHTLLIDPNREKDLLDQRNKRTAPPFYAGIEIHSRNELLWVFEREQWSGAPIARGRARPDLRAANLIHIDLAGQDLVGADLLGTILIDKQAAERLRPPEGPRSETGKARRGPYHGIPIRTRSELLWVMRENHWSGDARLPNGYKRPNLSGADMRNGQFQCSDLERANLRYVRADSANFSGARMGKANLRGAIAPFAVFRLAGLRGACLDSGKFTLASFDSASLFGAHCRHAQLVGTRMCYSNLSVMDIRGTDCREANLRGVDLRGARVDAATSLIDVALDTYTKLGDIVWYGVPLTQIRWDQAPILGDEREIMLADRDSRRTAYSNASRAYRGLWTALRRQGIYDVASQYRLRQKRIERAAMRNQGGLIGWIKWLSSVRSDIVAGYGEEPWKALIAFLVVIVLYGFAYFGVTNLNMLNLPTVQGRHLSLPEAMLFSFTIFEGHAQGMGAVLTIISISETFIGAYILLAFTVLNTRRLLGRA